MRTNAIDPKLLYKTTAAPKRRTDIPLLGFTLYICCALSPDAVLISTFNLPCCSFRCFKLRVLFSFFLCFNQGVSPLIPGGEDEITFELEGESFGVADTCQSATVPSYFQPYTTTTPVDWIASGAFMSYGYR